MIFLREIPRNLRFFLPLLFFFQVISCKSESRTPTVSLPNGSTIKLKLALTAEEQRNGLSHVKHLPEDEGMLFIYKSPAKLSFWMKDCYIPLDLIWLNSDGVVMKIVPMAKPWPPGTDPSKLETYSGVASSVLELAGGVAKKHDLKVGNKVKVNL